MNSLFPELHDTTNLTFVTPSKKGKNRFQSADPELRPLDRDMCVELIVSDLIRGHVLLIADLSLRMVPKLMDRLSSKHLKRREWTVTWANKLEAVKIVHGLKSKQDAGFYLIQNLITAPTTAPEIRRPSMPMKKITAHRPMKRISKNPFNNSNNPFDEEEYVDSWAA